jgi:ubiquitin-like protein Pup
MATKDSGGGQQRATRKTQDADQVQEVEETDLEERQEQLTDDVDAILDEIDEVLEENSEDFVKAYVQKGGE